MYHYQKNIGDYRSATMHLSLLEHGVYNQLLDWYYLDELPLSLDNRTLFRRLSAKSEIEQQAVLDVLQEMFTKTDEGWTHKRVEREISKYHIAKKNHWAAKLPKHIRNSIQAERNANKAKATPPWLTKQDRADIATMYADSVIKSTSTGIPHEVDHIVPLRSKIVCGLHVPWNLQVVKASENRRKSNLFEVI